MALAETFTTGIDGSIRTLAARLARILPRLPEPAPLSEADRDRRRFLSEMLEENAGAFHSEVDVQCMMHVFPGRY